MNQPHRTPSHPLMLVFAFALAILSAPPVSAHERPRNLDIRFNELDVRVEHGKLQVTYEIDGKDWQQLEQLKIRPVLNLYTPSRPGVFEFAHAVPVTGRSATVYYPHDVTPRGGRFIEVRLSGERGRTKIATTSFGPDCGSRVRLLVSNRGQRRGHRGDDRGRHGDDSDVAIIEACSSNTSWSGDFRSCLDLAANVQRNPVGTIEACSAATSWSGDFKSCLGSAAAYRVDASPTIMACKAATSWSGDFKACVDEARQLGPRAPRVVSACDEATSWSGEFKQCLVASRRG